MSEKDRVVSTSILRDFASQQSGALAIAAGTLRELEPGALHVVSSTSPIRLPGKVMICDIQLDVGEGRQCRMPVFVPITVWRRLPTCASVIGAATRLIPEVTDEAIALYLAEPEEDPGDDQEPPSFFDEPVF